MDDQSTQVAAVIISIVALGLSAVTAIWSLVYSRRQTRAAARANALTEKAQRERVEPYVVVDIRPRVPGSSLLVLVIENIGPTVARDVQVTVDQPLQTMLGDDRAEALNKAVGRRIAALPPKRRYSFVMDIGHRLFASELPKVYEFTVEASGPFGKVDPLIYTVDLNVLRGSNLETESVEWSLHLLAEQAKASASAQSRQTNTLEYLAHLIQQFLNGRRCNHSNANEAPGDSVAFIQQIPMESLDDMSSSKELE